jgi:thermostable 8-oxoguanine DNA glycosylase
MISEWERQARLIYSIIVAGKSANFADAATRKLLGNSDVLPFNQVKSWITEESQGGRKLADKLREARVGNYTKIEGALRGIIEAVSRGFDLTVCTPQELETIHGIGPKTSRFFIMWTRPEEEFAALDVHVLRWLREQGYDAPKATPSSKKKYSELERAFVAEAHKRGMTARELDEQIWVAGAGRTQETTTAEPSLPS